MKLINSVKVQKIQQNDTFFLPFGENEIVLFERSNTPVANPLSVLVLSQKL